MSEKKIFQIITLSELGGAQTVVLNLANELARQYEVTVIAGDGDGKLFQMLDPAVKHIRINSLKRNISLWNDFKTWRALRKLYAQYKPDIIHLHSSKAGALGRLAFPRDKIVYTVHGFDSIRLAYRKFLPIERWLQKCCKAIVAVSHHDERSLKAERITHNVSCVYYGIGESAAEPVKLTLPRRYRQKVLCIARISKQKRFSTFLETAALLPEYAFIWIGNQEPVQNVPENVFCLGSLKHAESYNQAVDLFILPTNYEGLPLVIFEALKYGLPVVASNVSGISEIVVDNENGYTVDNSGEAFAEKIKYILENPKIAEKFSRNSLRRFQKDLTVNKMVAGYLKIYNIS
ncbi:glycosyl transferase group 1 [Candidatus Termititenax dinenymphae]|uniref:Glycosyl transferase group 1 n=1 Tax=Candidatus Termititenax dinenymphae TaxID=2218523 RepID=A0A388TMX7_9BACT|nr:glycosyl transferase group 1 [Candidatus Termititenax dinenymphae]